MSLDIKDLVKYLTLEEYINYLKETEYDIDFETKVSTNSGVESQNIFLTKIMFYEYILINYLCVLKNIDPRNIYMSVTLVSNEEIKKINRDMRNIDKVTDVLSFPGFNEDELVSFLEGNKLFKNVEKNEKEENDIDSDLELDTSIEEYFGDIVISVDKIVSQAEEYGHLFIRELTYLSIHSFLHILGYDHIIESDKKIMREKEKEILKDLNI